MSDLIANLLDNPLVHAAGTALILAVVASWLAAAWWAYRDAARRTESSVLGYAAAGWIILSTPLLLPLSLAIYAFARPSTPAAEQREQALALALATATARSSCAACGAATEHDWVRCPACASWLAAACSRCGNWAPAGLDLCPFCGTDAQAAVSEDAAVETITPPVTVKPGAAEQIPSQAAAATLVAAPSRSQA